MFKVLTVGNELTKLGIPTFLEEGGCDVITVPTGDYARNKRDWLPHLVITMMKPDMNPSSMTGLTLLWDYHTRNLTHGTPFIVLDKEVNEEAKAEVEALGGIYHTIPEQGTDVFLEMLANHVDSFKTKVLLVSNIPSVVRRWTTNLRRSGYQVQVAGQDAVRVAEKSRPDIILVDYHTSIATANMDCNWMRISSAFNAKVLTRNIPRVLFNIPDRVSEPKIRLQGSKAGIKNIIWMGEPWEDVSDLLKEATSR